MNYIFIYFGNHYCLNCYFIEDFYSTHILIKFSKTSINENSYIALGVVYENTVDSPLLSWSDPHLAYDISQVGLSTVGAAVLYGVDCGLDPELFYPDGTCRLDDEDCQAFPNTRCVKPAVPPGKKTKTKTKTFIIYINNMTRREETAEQS